MTFRRLKERFKKVLSRRRRRPTNTEIESEEKTLNRLSLNLFELLYNSESGTPSEETLNSLEALEPKITSQVIRTADNYKIICPDSSIWIEFKSDTVDIERPIGNDLGLKLHISLSNIEQENDYISNEVWRVIVDCLMTQNVAQHFKVVRPSKLSEDRQPGKDVVIYLGSVLDFDLSDLVTNLDGGLREVLDKSYEKIEMEPVNAKFRGIRCVTVRNDQGPFPYELGNTELNYINASRGEHEIFAMRLQEVFQEEYPFLDVKTYDPIGSLFFQLNDQGAIDTEDPKELFFLYKRVEEIFIGLKPSINQSIFKKLLSTVENYWSKFESSVSSIESETSTSEMDLNIESERSLTEYFIESLKPGERIFLSSIFRNVGYLSELRARELRLDQKELTFSTRILSRVIDSLACSEGLNEIVRTRIEAYAKIHSCEIVKEETVFVESSDYSDSISSIN